MLLELARVLKEIDVNSTIILIIFGAEEKIGIPAVWLERLPDSNWHAQNDKFKNIEKKNLQQIGDLVYSFFVNYQTNKINFLYHYGIKYN
ncbi:MAG: hypothetical protein KAV97_00830 [Actinomycetia bacterium]|nr:hypothetical protein [Actinomycetes bacterium]